MIGNEIKRIHHILQFSIANMVINKIRRIFCLGSERIWQYGKKGSQIAQIIDIVLVQRNQMQDLNVLFLIDVRQFNIMGKAMVCREIGVNIGVFGIR